MQIKNECVIILQKTSYIGVNYESKDLLAIYNNQLLLGNIKKTNTLELEDAVLIYREPQNGEEVGEWGLLDYRGKDNIIELWEAITFLANPELLRNKKISHINAPGLKEVPAGAFCGCMELITFFAPNCKKIGKSAFEGCRNLKAIDFSNVELIGVMAFKECFSIKEIELPYVRQICAGAFQSCKKAEESPLF